MKIFWKGQIYFDRSKFLSECRIGQWARFTGTEHLNRGPAYLSARHPHPEERQHHGGK